MKHYLALALAVLLLIVVPSQLFAALERQTYVPLLAVNAAPASPPLPTDSGTLPLPTRTPTALPVTEGFLPVLADEVLALVNVERARVGCPALQFQPQMAAASAYHSQDMALHDFAGHFQPYTRNSSSHRLKEAGYLHAQFTNEIIVYGGGSAESIVGAWMASSAHRHAMLNCAYDEAGPAVYYQPDDGPVHAVNFRTGELVPIDSDGYSTDPITGSRYKGPYFYYTTLTLADPDPITPTPRPAD